MKVIDSHAHAVPPDLLKRLSTKSGAYGFGARPVERGWMVDVPGAADELFVPPRMVDPGDRKAWCDEQGITAQVLSPWMDLQPAAGMSPPDARAWARTLNEYLAEPARPFGDGPTPALATVAVDDPDAAADDLALAVHDLAMAGLLLSTSPPGNPDLSAPELEPLWAAAECLQVPVVLHPPSDGPSSRMPGAAPFANVFGRLVDSTFAVARLILSGLLDRHPDIKLVVVHGGGFLPFQANRLDGGHRMPGLDQFKLVRERPSAYLSDLYYDTVALSAGSIRFLRDAVGSQRLLFGTDYPFSLGGSHPVGAVRDSGLAEQETQAVLGLNASALFDMGAT